MLKLHVTLTTESPLHIGALSPAGTSAMRGLAKDFDGWPYIPASAFKGRLRHAAERLARGLNYTVCDTHHHMCREVEHPCVVCRSFGSAWVPGQVCFANLTLSGPEELARQRQAKDPARTTQRFGVALSRTRKVAADHLLYTTELFFPGVPLEFSGDLTSIPDLDTAAWLAASLRYLESVGSSRTRGLGWVAGQAEVFSADGQLVPARDLQAHLPASGEKPA